MPLKFDILQTPPSADALALARESAAEIFTRQERRGKRLNWEVGSGALFLGIIFLLSGVFRGLFSWDMAGIVFVGWALPALLLMACAVFLCGNFSAMPWFLCFGLSLLFSAILIPIAHYDAHGFWNLLLSSSARSLVMVSFSFFLVLVADGFHPHGIFWPKIEDKTTLKETLRDLAEIDPVVMADSCLEYMAYVDQYPEIGAYQNQVLALGRKPVVAECRAAKAWVEKQSLLEKTERAQKACERMATNLTPAC